MLSAINGTYHMDYTDTASNINKIFYSIFIYISRIDQIISTINRNNQGQGLIATFKQTIICSLCLANKFQFNLNDSVYALYIIISSKRFLSFMFR